VYEFYWRELVALRSFGELLTRFPAFVPSDVTCPLCGHCPAGDDGEHNDSDGDVKAPFVQGSPNLCSKGAGTMLEKDILDIWFDSGVCSYYLVQVAEKEFSNDNDTTSATAGTQQVMVCEGPDQHRGWFQALLLCSHVLRSEGDLEHLPRVSCYMTHAFCVDQKKKKLSKSAMAANHRPRHLPSVLWHPSQAPI